MMFYLISQLSEAVNTRPLKQFMLQAQQELEGFDIQLTKLDGEALNDQAHAFFTATHDDRTAKFVVSWKVDGHDLFFGFKSEDGRGYDYDDLTYTFDDVRELEGFLEAWFEENG